MERKIFLDIGAHIGESADFWEKRYPDFEIICFEPFPNNIKTLKDKGHVVVEGALWVENDEKNFYTGLPQSGSLYKSKRTGGLDPNRFIKIKTYDVVDFLKENFTGNEFIVMKMNCEGAEYDIIEKMYGYNLLNWVNKWYIEWHWQKIKISKERHDHVSGLIDWDEWQAMRPHKFNFKGI